MAKLTKNSTKKAVRDEWVRRLNSGKYRQSTGYLRTQSNGYCCLGVLCDIAVESGIIPAPIAVEGQEYYAYGKATAIPPTEVRKWVGLRDPLGNINKAEGLARMNDQGKTFSDIAKIVESAPKNLFGKVNESIGV